MIITVAFTTIKFFNYRALIGGTRESILGFATAANLKPNNDTMEEMQIKMLYWNQVPKETDCVTPFYF